MALVGLCLDDHKLLPACGCITAQAVMPQVLVVPVCLLVKLLKEGAWYLVP